ncbi:hypothetical protein ACQCN2_22360 [Brevibacillus ginsengisoli]|uniref:hypothetical protein n=1 Tax=Brevibacillus ginsengisoli TaxID=363854 RepID=UPI003CE76FDA
MQYRKQEELRIKMINRLSALLVIVFVLCSFLMIRVAYDQLIEGKVYASQSHSEKLETMHLLQEIDRTYR